MSFIKPHNRVRRAGELTDYEKKHAMELFVQTNGYILSLKEAYRLANTNGWVTLANELDNKLDLLETRSRELLGVLTK